MIDIAGTGADWIRRWQDVTFSPSKLFGSATFKLDSTGFLFATGCLFLGYVSAMIASIVYFALWYPENLRLHMAGEKLKPTAEVLTVVAGIYILAFLTALLVTAAISYLIYRRFGTGRLFEDHFAGELHLFNLEPIAALALTIFFVNLDNRHKLLAWSAFAVFVATRLYYLYLAYIALSCIHNLSRASERRAYFLGYIPPALMGLVVQVVIVWLLAFVATIDFDAPGQADLIHPNDAAYDRFSEIVVRLEPNLYWCGH